MSNPTKGSTNPYFKSKYADLNAVREAVIPTLNKHGISVLQPIVHIDGKNFVKTVLLHESGEAIEGLTEIIYAKTNDAQAQGSGITYARRYGLQSLICVGADDDDGNSASTPPKATPKESPKSPVKNDLSKVERDMVANAKSLDELTSVWKQLAAFQRNQEFIELVKKRKNELKAN